jgi:ribonuclease T2
MFNFRTPSESSRFLRLLAVAAILCFFAAVSGNARSKKPTHGQPSFSYYLLSLSYGPDFCAQPSGNKDPRECGKGRHVGFVVHGLWPQGDTGRGPENCGSSSPVSQAIVTATLGYIPTESLIQHEWTTHGTCSGLNAADYFAAVRKARDSVKIPGDLSQPATTLNLTPDTITAEFAAANPTFPKDAFRVACYSSGQLQEARICLDKNLAARACTASAGTCTAKTVTLLPVQ